MMLHSYHRLLFFCALFLCADSISALHCNQCHSLTLNYTVTADNLPPLGNCSIVTTKQYCYASVFWQLDGQSEVLYDSSDVDFPLEMVDVSIERRGSGAAQYDGERYVSYRCSSSDIPCNSPEHLKRVLISTTFPSDEQANRLNTLIAVMPFDNATCLISSNATECSPVDLSNCERCLVTIDYSKSQVCATCPKGSPNDVNWFSRSTVYMLGNRTHSMDTVELECQAAGQCNSLANVERIRQAMVIKFNFDKFFSSNATTQKLMLVMIIIALLISVTFN